MIAHRSFALRMIGHSDKGRRLNSGEILLLVFNSYNGRCKVLSITPLP